MRNIHISVQSPLWGYLLTAEALLANLASVGTRGALKGQHSFRN